MLAQQDTEGTSDLAWRTEQLLKRIVPPTGTGSIGEPTWCGLTIRRLAHVVEYAALGLTAAFVTSSLWGRSLRAAGVALGFCFVASLADETHKTLVPGRHFEVSDLRLDAVGYGAAVLVCMVLAQLFAR